MSYPDALVAHLATGATTLARAYELRRKDGLVQGFTDHDRDLSFGGVTYRADTGLTAKALQQATGLSVDNTEAFGALRSDAIAEEDILAGRYDGAEVVAWLVNWTDVSMRVTQFRGHLGEISRSGGSFTAELRGLSEQLNQPQGHIFHGRCSAVLGDARCKVDLNAPGRAVELAVEAIDGARVFKFQNLLGFNDRFFEKGRVQVLSGVAAGLVGIVKNDRVTLGSERTVELWQALGMTPLAGDMLRIEAGCDKAEDTCRLRFANIVNFRGFPDIPGEDWLMAFPQNGGVNDGGSLRR